MARYNDSENPSYQCVQPAMPLGGPYRKRIDRYEDRIENGNTLIFETTNKDPLIRRETPGSRRRLRPCLQWLTLRLHG